MSSQESSDGLMAAENTLLQKCKLDKKSLNKLFSLLTKFRGSAEDEKDLVEKFADRCYKAAGDPEASYEQAKNFCETAFGDISKLFKHGPTDAFEMRKKDIAKMAERQQWEFEFGKYYIGHQLGVGGTSEVLLGFDRELNREVAVKVYKQKYSKDAAKEGAILKELVHPNIINVYDSFENCLWKKHVTTVMVMEYANKGELIEYLMYTQAFEASLARWVFRGVLQAVMYCHSQDPPIVHRDLKHDNCLFGLDANNRFVVKINDFGFSKPLAIGESMKSMIGTEQYAAPEILRAKPYDGRVDIFALGVMLFVALSGAQPFKRADRNDPWYKRVTKGRWDKFWDAHMRRQGSYQYTDDERNLIEGMLAYDPDERFTLEDVKNHKWLEGETDSIEVATKKLTSRKNEMDMKKYRIGQGKGGGLKRAVGDELKAAVKYHTNIPSSGHWFYSKAKPWDIILTISTVISDAPFTGKTDYANGFGSSSNDQEDEEEKDDEDAVADGKLPKVVRLKDSTDGLSALKAMELGEYRLNFQVTANNVKYPGIARVFSCPDDRNMHIVIFAPGPGASTFIFPKIYANLLDGDLDDNSKGGVAVLMENPEKTRAYFEELELNRRGPRLSFSVE